ncbi:hypothetical protein [Hoylesella pleuritidis]|uniref:hypothetical protein n=1 Tax=Hoylesella pleuritidis TaxID=407975 RepID=UPI00235662E8|nr:hypothetical protein [Hoylesella pleuritidis]
MTGLKRTLPTSVRIRYDAEQAQIEIDNILRKANSGLVTLRSMAHDLGVIPEDLPSITMEWLDGVIGAKIVAAKAMPLPTDVINSMVAEWQAIKSKAATAVADILTIYAITPTLLYELQDGIVVCSNTSQWIESKATFTIPAKYNEHYRLLCNVVEAVDKLRYYEQNNGIPVKSLQFLLSAVKSPDDYAQMVVDGVLCCELTQAQYDRLYKYERMRL